MSFKKIIIPINNQNFNLYVADTEPKRIQGLSHIKKLPPHTGMIFLFEKDGPKTFTMEKTFIPLQIIFLDKDFKIIKKVKAYPQQKEKISCDKNARYVIEIPFS